MVSDVGFIGLGQMGLPMVRNLGNAGFSVTALDLRPDICAKAEACVGVSIAASPSDIARLAPVIFTCLPSSESIQAVYTGPDSIASSGKEELITCDCSTMAPSVSRALSSKMSEFNIHHLEAPIFGVPQQAHTADIYFAVSGDEEYLGILGPFLDAMGRGYRYVGSVGIAHTMKVLQNGLGMGHAALTAEILVVCERLGVDTKSFIDLVKDAGALGLSVFFERYAMELVTGEKSNAGLVPVSAKDSSLAQDLAHQVRLPAPILEEAAAVFQEAMDKGWVDEELTSISRIIRTREINSKS